MIKGYPQLVEKLLKVERYLLYAKACKGLLGTEAWKGVETALEDSNRALVNKLLQDDLDFLNMKEIRAEVRCNQRLLLLPRNSVQMIEEWERRVTHLRKKVADIKLRGLDQELPSVQAEALSLEAEVQGVES